MSRRYTLPCGCICKDEQLVEMCAACAADFLPRHEQAQIDYRANERRRIAEGVQHAEPEELARAMAAARMGGA